MLGLITLGLFAGYILAAYFIVKVQKSKRKKIIATTIMILIPTWDVIIGRTILYTLCASQGGVHVYQTVELGSEYFDRNGVPLFYARDKFVKNMEIARRYKGASEWTDMLPLFHLRVHSEKISDEQNDYILGEVKYFIYNGGWVFNSLKVGGGGGKSCPSYSGKNTLKLSKKIFLLKGNTN